MSKGNNQRGRYNALNIRLAKYVALVQAVYDMLNQQAANIAMMTGYDGSKEFHFSDFPQVREAVQRLQQDYVQSMHAIIYRGTSDEWKQSNLVQDLLADKILGKYSSKSWGLKHEVYYQTNSDALKAFQQRKDNGMGLSQRIWNMSGNYKEELEYSISTAIQKGTSAVQLSKKLSKYLNDFPSLKKDYKEKYGKAVDCHDCEYRSIRLARSEINMAYRTAEQLRWMQMDFVLGKEIKLSKGHKERDFDICDELAGRYPKDFDWKGWHSNCYLPNAQVLTNHGWKYIKDVLPTDLVLSLNPHTRNVEYVGLTAKQAFEYNGKIVHFYNRGLDCAVTANHRIVFMGKGSGRIRYTSAKEFRKTIGGFYRGCEYEAPERAFININGEEIKFDLFCEFMAYWLSDGSLQHYNNICIAQKVGEPAYDSILRCLSDMGYHAWFGKDCICFSNKNINEYLRQFGKCNNKFIPTEILNASKRQIQIFLDAYVKCDGYMRQPHSFIGNHGNVFKSMKSEKMYFTTSPQLCGDLCELILKAGLRPSISVQKPSSHVVKKDGKEIKGNYDCYVIRVCHSLTSTVFDKKIEEYNGMVYDLTLESNHIMYIQQNGKCYWGSNCTCYEIPILKTEEEFWHDEDTPPINQTKPVTEFPSGFNEYMEGHLDKISISNQKGTLSYWLRDNEDVKGCALLMNKAKQVGNVVQDIAERIAGEHGAIVTPINYKGFASLYRKVHYADQYGVRTALTEVKDSVRNTIVLDGDLDSVIKDLAKDSHWLRTKVQTADKFCGYSGNIVNLTMDNGVVAEIQVNTPKMIFAKESEKHARAILGDELYDKIAKETGMEGGLGHKLYEQIRVLDKVADAEKKASLEKQMRDYYSHFQSKAKSIEEIVEDKIKELSNFDKDEVREVFYFGDKAGVEMSKYRKLLTSDKFDIKKFKDYYYSDEDKIGKLEDSYENLRDRVNKELYLAGYEFRSYYQPLIDRFDKTPFAIYKSSKDYTDELIAIEKEVKKLNKKILYTPLRAEEYGKYTAIGKLTLSRLNNATLEEINHYVERLDTIIGEKERPGMSLEFKLQRKDLNKVLTTQVKDPNTLLRFYDFWQSDGGAVWDCVDHLHELVNATDLDKIPRRWRYEFNKLTKELTAENIKGNGVLYYYRHIEGAYNIYKLSTMKECVDFGLSRLSTKTPWNLCKIYVDNKWDLKDLPLKGFFDKENLFTPLYDRNVKNHFNVFSDAYFMPGYQHVCINKSYFSSSGRGAKSLYERKNICYHEFGHALDDDKMFSEELKPVYREYAKKLNDGQDQKIRAKFWKTFDDMLDKAPNQAAIEMIQEEVTSVSDVIQAMLDDHEMWFGGHSGTYFERESNQLAEVVAHMSENYWWGNDFFKKVWPEFYSALYQVAKKCFK